MTVWKWCSRFSVVRTAQPEAPSPPQYPPLRVQPWRRRTSPAFIGPVRTRTEAGSAKGARKPCYTDTVSVQLASESSSELSGWYNHPRFVATSNSILDTVFLDLLFKSIDV